MSKVDTTASLPFSDRPKVFDLYLCLIFSKSLPRRFEYPADLNANDILTNLLILIRQVLLQPGFPEDCVELFNMHFALFPIDPAEHPKQSYPFQPSHSEEAQGSPSSQRKIHKSSSWE